jgi:MFS family permease
MLDPGLLRRPELGGTVAFALLAYLAALGFLFLNTLYLQRVRGFSALHAGVAILPMTAAVAITAPMSGRLTGRRGARQTIAAAGLLIACAMAILATITPETSYGVLAVAYVLLGIGWGAINPPVTSLAISALPEARAGMASAIAGSARQVGSLLGVALMGSLVARRLGSASAPSLAARRSGHQAFTAALHLGYLVGLGAAIAIVLLAAVIRLPSEAPDARAESPSGEPGLPRTPTAPVTQRAGSAR